MNIAMIVVVNFGVEFFVVINVVFVIFGWM